LPFNPLVTERLTQIEQSITLQDLEYAKDQLDIFLSEVDLSDDNLLDQILNIQLQILIGEGRYEELEKALDKVDAKSIETDIRCLMAKGILANRNRDYQASLIFFLEAGSKAKSANLPKLLAQVQINIGTVYAGLHHYQQGLDLYSDVLNNFRSDINISTQAALLHNLGNLNYAIGNTSESIRCLEASIDLNNENLVNKSRILLVRSQLVNDGTSSYKIEDLVEDDDLLPIILYCKSFYETSRQSLITLAKAVELSKENNDFKTALDALERIVEIHKASSDWKKAFIALEKFRAIEQSMFSVQQTAKLAKQAVRYELAEKEKSIAVLQKEKALKDEIVKRNEMLEVANEELRQFAYVVSHDLKEPLRMIGAYTQLIELGLKGNIDEDQKDYFGFVSGGVSRLNILLDGLSNYSTLKSLQEQHEIQSLKEIIQTAIENLDILVNETKSSITLHVDVEVNGSTTLLVLLFQNLIQNSIKFRQKDTVADIHIKARKDSEKTIIEVSDNGLGIAKNQRDRVFVIFQRLTRNHSDGSGMGLAICKKIVQIHGGRITVTDSAVDKGTTFRIELPN